MSINEIAQTVESTLKRLISHQQKRVNDIARRLAPGASRDDLLNPQDIKVLTVDPQFNYEDGVLAGLLSAQIALRREIKNVDAKSPKPTD